MRAFDRDLIRGGHYGQRSCESASLARRLPPPFSDPMIEKLWTVAEIPSSRTDEADSVFAGWAYRVDQ
jgi:hypothetical protein